MPSSMRLLNGIGQKLKAKYFFLGFFSGIVFLTAFVFAVDPFLNEEYDDVTIEDFGPHYESDFSIEGAIAELKLKDRWMLQYIDPPPGIDPKDVYAFNCELLERKPESLTTLCADFGIAVWKIKWSMWSANGAEGSGLFMANDCEPSCAEGSFLEVPVNVYLSDLTTDGKNYFLNTATIVPKTFEYREGTWNAESDGFQYFVVTTKVKGKEVYADIWDIASFYRETPNMRTKRPN
jgi:hypothetical protein